MRISSKGRYGLATMIYMAQKNLNKEYITVISIAEELGISKIYLEQVFSLLKRANIITSIKGAQGGYRLTKNPEKITAYDVLFAIEQSIFEKTESSVSENAIYIERAMQGLVFDTVDASVEAALKKVYLSDLVALSQKHKANEDLMFFI